MWRGQRISALDFISLSLERRFKGEDEKATGKKKKPLKREPQSQRSSHLHSHTPDLLLTHTIPPKSITPPTTLAFLMVLTLDRPTTTHFERLRSLVDSYLSKDGSSLEQTSKGFTNVEEFISGL